jgi:hypothetical protein
MRALVEVATSGKSDSARVAAAIAILDRAFGKPHQSLRGETENPKVIYYISDKPMTNEEWEQK